MYKYLFLVFIGCSNNSLPQSSYPDLNPPDLLIQDHLNIQESLDLGNNYHDLKTVDIQKFPDFAVTDLAKNANTDMVSNHTDLSHVDMVPTPDMISYDLTPSVDLTSPHCGNINEACCNSNTCYVGNTCFSGTCYHCGGKGELCCSNNQCNVGACSKDNTCLCGRISQQCCGGVGGTCDDLNSICNGSGMCQDCGIAGQACCIPQGYQVACNDGSMCTNDKCQWPACGQLNQQCCPQAQQEQQNIKACSQSYWTCNKSTNKCIHCGAPGQPVCPI